MLFNGTTLFDLGSLGGSSSAATAINDAGQAAGWSTVTNGAGVEVGTEAFLYTNGFLTRLGTLGGPDSLPSALHNAGAIVGESSPTNGDVHGFIYITSALNDLGN